MARKAFKQVWKSITGVPAVNFATKRYTFVTYDANGDIITPAAGAKVIGVIEEPNNIGEPAQVIASGFSFVELGATLAPGAVIMTSATGVAVAHVDATSPAVNYVAGTLVVGGDSGDIGTILIN